MNYQATTTTFSARVFDFLANLESPERKAYDGKDGTITIGPGYNLTDLGNTELRRLVFTALGLNYADFLYKGTESERIKEAGYLQRLDAALKSGPSQLSELNNIMQERYNAALSDAAYGAYIQNGLRSTFAFSSGTAGDTEMRAVMAEGIKKYETLMYQQLGFTATTAPAGFVGSKEMVALLSLVYNGLGAWPSGLKKASSCWIPRCKTWCRPWRLSRHQLPGRPPCRRTMPWR